MKKFILFFLAVLIACFTSSCSFVKHSVKNEVDGEIKSLSVKTYKVNGTFYNFLPMYSKLEEDIVKYDKVRKEWNEHIKFLEEHLSYWVKRKNTREIDRLTEDINSAKTELKEIVTIINNLQKNKESIKQTYKNGNLYIARYIGQTKNGIYENSYTYRIFLFNEDNRFEEYNGEDFYTLVFSKYPKAKKYMMENLLEVSMNGIISSKNTLSNLL